MKCPALKFVQTANGRKHSASLESKIVYKILEYLMRSFLKPEKTVAFSPAARCGPSHEGTTVRFGDNTKGC